MARRPLQSQNRGNSGQAQGSKKAKPWSEPSFDASVSWDAEKLQPNSRLTPGSVQPLVVEVTGPVDLDEQVVEILYDGAWRRADWTGEVGKTRQAIMMIEASPGAIHHVKVRVRAGLQTPVLDVGIIRVNRR